MNPEHIRQLEILCEKLFTSPNPQDRAAAEQQLAVFTTVDGAARIQAAISQTNHPYALFFVSSTLLKVLTASWASFTTQQVLDIRNFLFQYIGQAGTTLPKFVRQNFVQLICRITKLGWFDDKSHKELPGKISQFFLTVNAALATLGMEMLNGLINEMNTVTSKMTLTQHRRIAVSFRDACLKDAFEYALNTLKTAASAHSQLDDKLCEESLELILNCLRFDFVGIFPDESTDDVGRSTIQVPTGWKQYFEDPGMLKLFWDLYERMALLNKASKPVECLVMISSVRRSLFTGDKERLDFLQSLLKGTQRILETKIGLNDQATYHEFCRLLARMKSNFQLSEIVGSENYEQWILLIAKFSIESFQSWQWTSTSVYYLLNLWSRLVSSMPYLKGDKPSGLDNHVPEITQSFIMSRMDVARVVILQSNIENPLEDEEALTEQLEAIPTLVHSNAEKIVPTMLTLFDPLLNTYQEGINRGAHLTTVDELRIAEGQLAWLSYFFGAVIGQRTSNNRSDSTDLLDGEMTARAIRCASLVEQRILSAPSAVEEETLQRLESSVLYFLQSFRKVYIGESAILSSQVYNRLSTLLGLGDHLAVLNVIVNKVAQNLKIWGKCARVIQETLDLFFELASGYSSAKLMLKLETIHFILINHNSEHFNFMLEPANLRQRSKYYCTLCKLLFMQDYSEQNFLRFMHPLEQVCLQLEQISNLAQFSQDTVKFAFIGLLRDLRGVCTACMNKQTYNHFFEWIYPTHTPLLVRVAEVFFDDSRVMLPLLKLIAEIVLNRSQRINFDSSSPNGILLFKETSKILVTFGSRIKIAPVTGKDLYAQRYKSIWTCMSILSRALSGNYCNFGVFALYGDSALADALDVVVKLAVSIPIEDIMAFPKVYKAYFGLLEILFHNHCGSVANFDSAVFLHLVASLEEGISSSDTNLSSQCCAALDHMCTFYYKQASKKNNEDAIKIQRHLQQKPDLLPRLLALLFNLILFENVGNQWSMSRPMLSLIVVNENFFQELKLQIANLVWMERRESMLEALNKLMEGVEPNLESKNREKFTGNLAQFKQTAKNFL